MILAHKSCVVNGFLGEFSHVGLSTNYTDVIRFYCLLLICKGDMLTYQHSNAYSRHVEPIKEGLYIIIDLHPLPFPLVFEYALGNGCHYTVMPPFDPFQGPREALVVVVEFRRPVSFIVCRRIIPPRGTFACTIGKTVRLLGPVLALFDTRVVCGLAKYV